MAFIQLGKFSMGWGGGNNRFIKTPSPIGRLFGQNTREEWVTISGHEYEIYKTTPEVNIVFGRFAEMLSNGRWVHKRNDGTKEGKVIEDSPLVTFLERPNPLQTGEEFIKEGCLHFWTFGNNIIYPVFGSSLSTIPSVMNNLPANYMKVVKTGKRWEQDTIDGIIEKYILENYYESDKKEFKPNEIIHRRYIDPKNPVVGQSVMEALHMPISNIRGAYGFRNVNITKRGALGFITNSSDDAIGNLPISAPDRAKIEKQYSKETHGIHDDQAPVAMVSGDLKWVSTAYEINKMMLFEEVSEDMKKIIDKLNLNDNIFSKEKASTYANLREGLKMAYQDGIIPFAQDYASAISKGLRLPDNEWLELDYSHVAALQDDDVENSQVAERNARAIKTLVEAGYTKEEATKLIMKDEK